jgi:hypothetical protein
MRLGSAWPGRALMRGLRSKGRVSPMMFPYQHLLARHRESPSGEAAIHLADAHAARRS